MPLTVNDPLAPEIVPGVVVPSPQSMAAVNADAVSLVFPSLKVTTLWLLASPSVTAVSRKSPGANPTMALLVMRRIAASRMPSRLRPASTKPKEVASWSGT